MPTRTIEGGERLQRALADIGRRIGRRGSLKVGFLENATYPDGTPVAMVAAIHNFGAPSRNIPARPFFSNMVARHSSEWPGEIRAQLKSTNYDARQTMNRMGALIKGELQQSIRDTNEPPLKPATIRRKGFDKPLIDTGHMLNSVAFEYED
jgi:phage gpG-like protein